MKISLLGCGNLALGLVCPWLSRLPGCDLSVMTRLGRPETGGLQAVGRYHCRVGIERATEGFAHDFFAYDPSNLDAPEARACIDRLEESHIAAVSVRVDNLSAAARLIARACLRSDLPPLHLLAFENAPQASTALLRAIRVELTQLAPGGQPGREIIAHAAIPDRACMARGLDDDGIPFVEAERFGEIVLESSARHLFPTIQESAYPIPSIHYVDSDSVHLAERRKFWLVNGTHVALGVLCYEASQQRLSEGLADGSVWAVLHSLHEEWVQILHVQACEQGRDSGIFDRGELAAHAERVFERLRDLPDFSVKDVLKELSELADIGQGQRAKEMQAKKMQRLLQKLDDRLAHQVRRANEMGGIAVPASGWMLAQGVGTIRRHADTHIIGGSDA